jgi:hypothetical protein
MTQRQSTPIVETLIPAPPPLPLGTGDDDQPLESERQTGFSHLLRSVAVCWLAYVGVLYLLDIMLVTRTPQLQLLPLYYLFHVLAALFLLRFSGAWQQRRLGRAFVPLVFLSRQRLNCPKQLIHS